MTNACYMLTVSESAMTKVNGGFNKHIKEGVIIETGILGKAIQDLMGLLLSVVLTSTDERCKTL